MPTSAELIEAQRHFEQERGLEQHNTLAFGLLRMYEELGEAVTAYYNEPPENLLTELADVTIFAHSLMGRVAENLGWKPEDVDQLIDAKMARNHTKYDTAFFENGHDSATAITLARHWWNLGLHDVSLGNDYY